MQTVQKDSASEGEIRQIITSPKSGGILVDYAERLGKELAKTLKSSQIRAIFDEAHRIASILHTGNAEAAVHRAHLLKPKLAYRATRVGGVSDLAPVLTKALDVVLEHEENLEEVRQRYFKFLEFFEAIVAYHKYYGGRD